jgi:hypothetical protein
MSFDDDVIGELNRAVRNQRPYAGFFAWQDREVAEWGVAESFATAASAEPGFPLQNLRSRGAGNDPPDCEALDADGRSIAIEITELVDGDMIAAARRSSRRQWRTWNETSFRVELQERLADKDGKKLKGGEWAEYVVLVHTDEPALTIEQAQTWLEGYRFQSPRQIGRAFLLLSYDPFRRGYPYVQLRW